MKGCVAAGVVLLLITLLVAGNAVYVRHVTDRLSTEIAALPEYPDPAVTAEAVAAATRTFRAHVLPLSISVNYALLARTTETLRSLEAYAAAGDAAQYAATLAVLFELIEDLSRSERLSAEALF